MDQKDLYKAVGALIRRARIGIGLTQESLAKGVGLTRTSLTNIEKGRQKLLLHTLVAVAGKLEVSVEELLPKELQKNAPKELKFSDEVPIEVRSWIEKTLSVKNENTKNTYSKTGREPIAGEHGLAAAGARGGHSRSKERESQKEP